jgi:hypothetical protein
MHQNGRLLITHANLQKDPIAHPPQNSESIADNNFNYRRRYFLAGSHELSEPFPSARELGGRPTYYLDK